MKLRPLNDRILVKRVEEEAKTKGGIIIPGNVQDEQISGRVVAVGTGRVLDNGETVALNVTEGDEVSMPVAVYNYLESGQQVQLTLEEQDWFESLGKATQAVDDGAGAAHGVMDAPLLLKLDDEPVDGRGVEGIAADEQGVKTEDPA